MRFLLSAVLVAAAAVPAAGADDLAVLRKQLPKKWVSAMSSLKSMRAQREFFDSHSVLIKLVPAGSYGIGPDAFGRYEEGNIYIDESNLLKAYRDLKNGGLSDAEALETLVWKSIPDIGHEIMHGIVGEEIKELAGFQFGSRFRENELVALYQNVRIVLELIKKKPGLWEGARLIDYDRNNMLILTAWQRGPAVFTQVVDDTYAIKDSLLAADRKALLAEERESVKGFEEGQSAVERVRMHVAEAADPEEKRRRKEKFKDALATKDFSDVIERGRKEIKLLQDERAYNSVVQYYKKKTFEIVEDCQKSYGGR